MNREGPWYIGGAVVAATADLPEDLAALGWLLDGFGRPSPEDPAATRPWQVELRRTPPRPLGPGPGLRHSTLLSGEPFAARLGERSRRYLVDGRLELALDLGRRRALCRLADNGAELLRGESGLFLIDAVVESQGQHMMHAALVALPPALPPGGLLLLGDSGAGKTTTSLALALGGFPLGADDTTILCDDEEGLAAWGLPRWLKVHREVAALLPAMAPLLPGDREESGHDAAKLPGVAVLQPSDRRVLLRAVAWLGPRSAGAHGYRRLAPIESLERLARRDLHAPRVLADATVRRQLRLFAKAARTLPALELSLGRDLVGLPAWLAAVLARELQG